MTKRKVIHEVKVGSLSLSLSLSLSILTAIYRVYLGKPVFIEAKDDGGVPPFPPEFCGNRLSGFRVTNGKTNADEITIYNRRRK